MQPHRLIISPLAYALVVILGFSVALPEFPAVKSLIGVSEAEAQTKKRKRRSLFDVLFKRRNSRNTQRANSRNRRPATGLPGVTIFQRNRDRVRSNRNNSTGNRPAPAPSVVVVKNDSAAKILVVGDFMASAIAKGLERQYSENPNFVIVNRGQANSGIVRDDVVDWASAIPQMIEEIKPVAVIVLVGMNDRQQMRLSSGRVNKLTDGWQKEYRERITKIASAGAQANLPLLWVGLPPVKSGAMNTDYLVFNEMYRSISESINVTFVDVWDGFTNAEGKFVSAGPDVNGQIVRLRTAKGINMTRAGQRKLGFFADRALRKLGIITATEEYNYAALGTINPNAAQPAIPEYDPIGSGTTVVLSLSSPNLDGGLELEGGEGFLSDKSEADSVSYELVSKGQLHSPQPGRVDAGWGKPATPKSKNEEAKSEDKTVVTQE